MRIVDTLCLFTNKDLNAGALKINSDSFVDHCVI